MIDQFAPCDLVVFAPHPDDAELTCGGLLLVARKRGWRTGVVEMTRGEMGTRGTAEIRWRRRRRSSGTSSRTAAFRRGGGTFSTTWRSTAPASSAN